jgi:TetR/AcrR family tetracycline transcriptional repressor
MTKQSDHSPAAARNRAPVGLTRDDVIDAAIEVLDDEGLDRVSLRRVAERLAVRPNTVAWHVGDKATLLEAMRDRLLTSCLEDPLPLDPEQRVRTLMRRLRLGLLSHRDGARLTIETPLFTSQRQLALSDAVLAAMLETDRSLREVAWTVQTLIYFILGLGQEQQGSRGRTGEYRDRDATVDPSLYPAVAAVTPYLGERDFDARFEYGLELILSGSTPPLVRPAETPARSRTRPARGQAQNDLTFEDACADPVPPIPPPR